MTNWVATFANTFRLRVKRSTGNVRSRWQGFDVPFMDISMSVLDALMWAQRHDDPTLAFRCACRVGMRGTCGSVINGKERLACRTQVGDLTGPGTDGGRCR